MIAKTPAHYFKPAVFFLMMATAFIAAVHAQTSPDTQFRPFVLKEYDPKEFTVSQNEFHNGGASIRITQAKQIAINVHKPPTICRAWIEVVKENKTTFQKYLADMDPAGFSYGVFIPAAQPPAPFFAVVKIGDYDGRLYLVNKEGKVEDLMGGFYFITNDKRYLFSQYATDGTGLVVYDLAEGRTVYSSDKIPHMHQWYFKDGACFFTESEWIRSNIGRPTEKPGIAHFYDFKTHQIISKKITVAERAAAKTLAFDFDPRDYEDCTTGTGKPLTKSGNNARR